MTTSSDKKSSKRTYGGLSEAERVNERRERFLEAGLEVFGSLGMRGATVRKLCKEASLTERYFYESFTDTDDLFCAVFRRQIDLSAQRFLALLPNLPEELEDRISACLELYFTSMRNDRVVRVLYIESLVGTDRVKEILHENVVALSALALTMLRMDNPDLQVSDDFAKALAAAINGAVSAVAVHWMLSGYEIRQNVLVESSTLMVLGTMRELKARYSAA